MSTMPLQCQLCGRLFARRGHLHRHERTHTAQRPFECDTCGATFARSDTLQRHVSSHDKQSALQSGGRACRQCVVAKTRCSNETPCKRCIDRGFACEISPSIESHTGGSTESVAGNGQEQSSADQGQLPSGMLNQNLVIADEDEFDFLHPDLVFATNWLEVEGEPGLLWTSPEGLLDFDLTGFDEHVITPGQIVPQAHLGGDSVGALSESQANNSTPSFNVESPDGEYYVDGDSARLPRSGRRRTSSAYPTPLSSNLTTTHFTLDPPSHLLNEETPDIYISERNWESIQDVYRRVCRTPSQLWPMFVDQPMPERSILNRLMQLYHSNFGHILPFIHEASFRLMNRHFVLDLAMVAVGSQYTTDYLFSASMQEFLRRYLQFARENTDEITKHHFFYSAAQLLNIVGMAYGGNATFRQYALQDRYRLKAVLSELQSGSGPLNLSNKDALKDQWWHWIQTEARNRLVHCLWFVDGLMASHFSVAPLFSLQDNFAKIPDGDHLWKAENELQWSSRYARVDSTSTTLLDLLKDLYIGRTFPKVKSEFVQVLAIQGLQYRLWDLGRRLSDPLSHWEPTTPSNPASVRIPKATAWLPTHQIYRKWQNVSCDALDVLHWRANASIGKARGMEHPTVLHLHFARLELLVPLREIVALARCTTGQNQQESSVIQRWVLQHQYKARLAMIHAGVVFWHIRRFGLDAFYEPAAAGLASLSLWAFAICTQKMSTRSNSPTGADTSQPISSNGQMDSLEDITQEIIFLDRPVDDELVQQFIRRGDSMKPHISGVGNIYATGSSKLILLQGVKLLNTLKTWSVSEYWKELLTGLAARS